MSEYKFKVGDKVKIIFDQYAEISLDDSLEAYGVSLGEEGNISYIDDRDQQPCPYSVLLSNGKSIDVGEQEIELVKEYA